MDLSFPTHHLSNTPLLQIQGIARNFGGLNVLRNVNFDVPEGSLVGLIGPNGSGKTTLFNIVSGFLPPSEGTIKYAHVDITSDTVQQRSRSGLVRTFQTPKVFSHLTVLENVMAGCYKHTRTGFVANMFRSRESRREIARIRDESMVVCARFGLGTLIHNPAGLLTAGQRRNLELARAFIGKPRILLLDEPSSGLTTEETDQLRLKLLELNSEGLTILLVSHDMALMSCVEACYCLCQGEIIASGDMGTVQQDPRVREAYLGA